MRWDGAGKRGSWVGGDVGAICGLVGWGWVGVGWGEGMMGSGEVRCYAMWCCVGIYGDLNGYLDWIMQMWYGVLLCGSLWSFG